ncbi:porin [Ferrimonas senticii]|uniref:porin n=1 Tax=Ferrimonas senticii TaxID=394566 RepID=UPI0003F73E99|nr:porin [Ferrimonas senticii]
MLSTKRTVLAAALAAAVIPSVAMAEALTLYGKVNIEAGYNDFDDSNSEAAETEVRSNSSRLGVKGEIELSPSLTAFYTVEYEVDTDSDDKNNFKARNQFVGLKGDLGSVALGRNDTVLKKSQGKVDIFSDYSGDMKNYGFQGENREEQTVSYLTPTLGLFSAGLTYVAEGSADSVDANGKPTDGFSLAAMYGDAKFKKSDFYLAAAYDADIDKQDSVMRFTAGAKVAGIKLGALYQQQEAFNSVSKDGLLLSAAYGIDDLTLKAQFVDMEDTADGFSVGADYKLAKTTKLFAYYTDRSYEDQLNSKSGAFAAVGLEHKF